MSKVDYCNVVLAGLPQRKLNRVQSVVNGQRGCSPVSRRSQIQPRNTVAEGPSLAASAWAWEVQAVRAYASLPYWSGAAIFDRAGSACRRPRTARRRLRSVSSADLVVPSTRRSTVGDRALAVASPLVWNSLPSDIRTSTNHSTRLINI